MKVVWIVPRVCHSQSAVDSVAVAASTRFKALVSGVSAVCFAAIDICSGVLYTLEIQRNTGTVSVVAGSYLAICVLYFRISGGHVCDLAVHYTDTLYR